MNPHNELIHTLSEDLKPVKAVSSVDRLALLWLLCSAAYVILVTHYFGPIRHGAVTQLLSTPRFLFETINAVAGVSLIALCGFRAAVPGRLTRRFATISFIVLGIWLLQYVVGLSQPTLAPSMEGKREECWLHTIYYSIPPMLAAFFITRRLFPLKPFHTTFLFCLAAGMLPALYMQLACMYLVPHILKFHILPGFIVALLGSSLSLLYSRNYYPPKYDPAKYDPTK